MSLGISNVEVENFIEEKNDDLKKNLLVFFHRILSIVL